MKRTTQSLLPALCLFLAATACSSAEDSDPPIAGFTVEWLRESLGVRLSNAEFFEEENPADGVYFGGEVDITLAGLGTHRLYMEETIFTPEEGGGVMEYVKDLETDDSRLFFYYPDDNQVLFAQDQSQPDAEFFDLRGTTVERQQDGTYFVIGFDDTQPDETTEIEEGADGFEAVKLVEKYADFSSMTPHMMLFAIAMGQANTPEARIADSCVAPNCPEGCEEGEGSSAARPSFCSIFKEFCDCAACSVNPDGTACPRCPRLSQ